MTGDSNDSRDSNSDIGSRVSDTTTDVYEDRQFGILSNNASELRRRTYIDSNESEVR